MAYEGYVDSITDFRITGWVYDDANPNEPLVVEILAGDRVVSAIRADDLRPDLKAAGKGDGRHGFTYLRETTQGQAGALSARVQGRRWRLQPTLAATGVPPPLYRDPRRRMLHSLEFGFPELQTAFTPAIASADEGAIVERLIEAFHRAVADDPNAGARKEDMWSEIESGQHGEVLALVRGRDVAGLSEYLRDAHARGLTWGITQGVETTAHLRESGEARRVIASQFMDYLASLAEYLGILDVESPVQLGQYGENLHADPQALVDAIAAQVGFAIETPPAIGSYFGIGTRGGVVTGRDLCSLYAALRLREIATGFGLDPPRVCEIGGGAGGVAYYCARMGMPITIIDLPQVSLLQGYFLLRSLPGRAIQLHGEPEAPHAAVRLLPTWRFADRGATCDILFNQDSFPEMSAAYAIAYLRQAGTSVKHAIYSINQEARARQVGNARQTPVRELVGEAGGFARSSRHRHWLRAGYVEEIFRRQG
jgi:hypothetical protein